MSVIEDKIIENINFSFLCDKVLSVIEKEVFNGSFDLISLNFLVFLLIKDLFVDLKLLWNLFDLFNLIFVRLFLFFK